MTSRNRAYIAPTYVGAFSSLPYSIDPPLLTFDHVPAGCVLRLVSDDSSLPHLRPGEFAVVDPADREPAERCLFIIEYSYGTPRASQHIVELFCQNRIGPDGAYVGWSSGPWDRPRSGKEYDEWIAAGRIPRLADGNRTAEGIREALRGRVLGWISSLACRSASGPRADSQSRALTRNTANPRASRSSKIRIQ